MKLHLTILLALISLISVFPQLETDPNLHVIPEKFPICLDCTSQLIGQLGYPRFEDWKERTDVVIVSCFFNTDLSITDLKVIKGFDPRIDKEVWEAVSKLINWLPAMQRHVFVNYEAYIAVGFKKSGDNYEMMVPKGFYECSQKEYRKRLKLYKKSLVSD